MAMDVLGARPINETSRYFRKNVWWWRPFGKYIIEVVPEAANRRTAWHSNDGRGLTDDDCVALADKLQAEIDGG